MESRLLYLFTRTPLHVGAGSSVGAIDQPIQRERHTGFPIIPGSALKGVIADANGASSDPKQDRSEANRFLFGSTRAEDDQAYSGSISFGEARILLFPVRTTEACFAWVTCPLVLTRWASATNAKAMPIETLASNEALTNSRLLSSNPNIVLEDSLVTIRSAIPDPIVARVKEVMEMTARDYAPIVSDHLVIISDDLFAYFVTSCCDIQQHVRINDRTGTASDQGLFNQENVPAESLFFAILHHLRGSDFSKLKIPPVLQIGADATTGLGFCNARLSNN